MNTFLHRPYSRMERVADELHQILGNMFINELFIAEAGLLTVTQVKLTDDLKLAKVYLSFLENKIPVTDLLDKINNHGWDSLSDQEESFLKNASNKIFNNDERDFINSILKNYHV